jgi:hypothetical protein
MCSNSTPSSPGGAVIACSGRGPASKLLSREMGDPLDVSSGRRRLGEAPPSEPELSTVTNPLLASLRSSSGGIVEEASAFNVLTEFAPASLSVIPVAYSSRFDSTLT